MTLPTPPPPPGRTHPAAQGRAVAWLAGAVLLAACAGGDDSATSVTDGGDEGPASIVLLTHDSFALSDGVLAGFTEDTGIEVELLSGGDAGAVLNQAILTRDNPTADVLFGVDNTFLTRALAEDLFVPYESPALDSVPDELQLDEGNRVTPVDYGDVCVNYDRVALAAAGLAAPETLADLTEPEYAGMLVVQDPAGSSPGLAFLLATIATFGEDGDYTWQDYWTDLAANDVLVASGWEEAYYGSFSGGAGEGDRPLVVSYASSPPAEVFYAEEPPAEAPTGAIGDGCFRQVEFAGILAGTEHEVEAQALIDFMLSTEFQEDIPLNMFVYPANEDAALPEVFVEHTTVPDEIAAVDPEDIDANREQWIQTWTDLLR